MLFGTVVGAIVDWFQKLPGFRRSPPGLEWSLWRLLPRILIWGTALPACAAALVHYTPVGPAVFGPDPAPDITVYALLGLVAFHWTLTGTVAIGCIVVMIMKGPAYVADGLAAEPGHDDRIRDVPAGPGRTDADS